MSIILKEPKNRREIFVSHRKIWCETTDFSRLLDMCRLYNLHCFYFALKLIRCEFSFFCSNATIACVRCINISLVFTNPAVRESHESDFRWPKNCPNNMRTQPLGSVVLLGLLAMHTHWMIAPCVPAALRPRSMHPCTARAYPAPALLRLPPLAAVVATCRSALWPPREGDE